MSIKYNIINEIIRIEGGYVNDPSDSGGETNYGITIAVARKYGYKGEMIDLPKETAFKIYSSMYWDSMNLDIIEGISSELAEELADTGVNMGIGRAATFLQRSLNVLNNSQEIYKDLKVDGDIGGKTIDALKSFVKARGDEGKAILFKMLNCLQGEFYISLAERREKDEKFIYGWFKNRVK